jgi:5-methylcytosine-specific restriction endonuclease McrA
MAEYKNYKDQYKHPNWQKKRLEILERDNYTCRDCGSTEKQLHVHHGYYVKGLNVWDYDNRTLWCLCHSCHETWGEMTKILHEGIAHCDLKDYQHIRDFLQGVILVQKKHKEDE